MYNVKRNNYIKNCKNSNVETPKYICDFIFNILKNKFKKDDLILDPCCGAGNLIAPFVLNNYNNFMAFDINYKYMISKKNIEWFHINYLLLEKNLDKIEKPNKVKLVLINPPFNLNVENKKIAKMYCKGRPLLPEVFLEKTIELFGKNVPIVLFTPYGFRLNQTIKSTRWKRFIDGSYPEISSIISLPKDAFRGVLFHSEILIFNISGLKPHYFIDNK